MIPVDVQFCGFLLKRQKKLKMHILPNKILILMCQRLRIEGEKVESLTLENSFMEFCYEMKQRYESVAGDIGIKSDTTKMT